MIIWKTFVEPHLKTDCNLCYDRVLNNYKQLQPIWIELEKQNNLIKNA